MTIFKKMFISIQVGLSVSKRNSFQYRFFILVQLHIFVWYKQRPITDLNWKSGKWIDLDYIQIEYNAFGCGSSLLKETLHEILIVIGNLYKKSKCLKWVKQFISYKLRVCIP